MKLKTNVLFILVLSVICAGTGCDEGMSFVFATNHMNPTYSAGDTIVARPVAKKIGSNGLSRYDIVAFVGPNGGKIAISRIAALPGDVVVLLYDNTITINGVPYDGKGFGVIRDAGPVFERYRFMHISDRKCIVPEGMLFVIGDNFGSSMDSRNYGPIMIDSIMGVVR